MVVLRPGESHEHGMQMWELGSPCTSSWELLNSPWLLAGQISPPQITQSTPFFLPVKKLSFEVK
jgi:hypothetical protein